MISPKVSVIVPCFNATKTLGRTLESAGNQTFRDFEVVVVDDGSSDDPKQVVMSLAERLNDPKFIRQDNLGVSAARNRAIEVAQGQFIAPLDSDDLWHPNYLEKMVTALEKADEQTVMAYAPSRIIDMDDSVIATVIRPRIDGSAFHRMMVKNFVENGSSIVFRKAVGDSFGNYDPSLPSLSRISDFVMQTDLCARGSVVTVPEYLVGYRHTPHSVSKNLRQTANDLLDGFRRAGMGRSASERKAIRYGIAGYMGWFAKGLMRTEPLEAFRLLAIAFFASPISTASRFLRSAAPTHIPPADRVHFYSLDTKHPRLLEPRDPDLPSEFRWAAHLDGAV